MNNYEDSAYINKIYDDASNSRQQLMTDLKNDKECLKEKVIYVKINCLDNIMKNCLKYRNAKYKNTKQIDG
jgi:hypothetical protein